MLRFLDDAIWLVAALLAGLRAMRREFGSENLDDTRSQMQWPRN